MHITYFHCFDRKIYSFVGTVSTDSENNPAYNVLRQYTDEIVSCNMEPSDIARKLFSKGVLNEQMFDNITDGCTKETKKERLDRVMKNVRHAVRDDESAFVTFIQAMVDLKIIAVNRLVRELANDYQKQGTQLILQK